MNEELEQIVQNMIDAGESEENIALVIQSYKTDPVKKKDGTKAPSTSTTQPVSTESEQRGGSLDYTTEKIQKSLSTGIKPIPSQKPELKLSKEAKEFVQNIRPEDKNTIPEKRSFLGETFAKLRKGSAQLGADIAAAPELIYDVFATPQNYIAKKLNIPSLATDAEKFKETVGIENAVKDYYKKDVENIKRESELVDKKYQQGIYDSFKSGNYEDGFRQLTNSFSESLPATVSIMVGGAYTKAPQLLTASTIVFGAGKNEMLKEQNPEMDSEKRIANALATGLAQGAFETLGSGSIGSAAKALVEREGRKKGMTILKDGLVNFYKESLKNNPMIASMSGEGIEEWATTVAENSIDVVTGVKPQDFNVFEGSVDSFISGVFGGAVFGAGLKGLDKISNPQDRNTIKQNFKKTFELQNQLENPNISEPVKIEIEKSIKTISKETQDLIGKNIDNVENLPQKVKEKLVDSTNKIDEIKKKAEEVKLDQNTSDASKQILLDSLKKEYEKELETRNGIIDGKVTEVDVLPLKEQDKIKREALKELTSELNPDGTKNITITDEQITERANKLYKKQQESESKDAETKIPTTETKIESETEVQEQPEVKEKAVAETTQEPIAPKENDEVILEPRIKGGLPRTIVFKDGEWQQKVGGQISPISESVKQEAQIKFDETQTQGDITPDANVRPAISEVGEMAVTEQPTTEVAETEVVESATEPPTGEEIAEITDAEYANFIDNGVVSEQRLDDIANKIKNNQALSERENAIFTDKTSDINRILSSQPTRKETETKISDATKQLANKVREFKTSRPDIFSTASPASLAWDLGVETVAKSIELSGNVAQAVADGLKAIKETDWYKSLDKDKMSQVDSAFEQSFSQLQSEPKKESVQEKIEPKEKQKEINIDINEPLPVFGSFLQSASTVPNSGEVGEYLSGKTIDKYTGEQAENDQTIQRVKLLDALRHGVNTIEMAKMEFGDQFVEKTLDFLENNNISIEAKALTYISLENELNKEKIEKPEEKSKIQKQLNLVREKRQAFARSNSLALNMNRLQAFAKVGYDINEATDKIFSSKEKEARKKIEEAIQSNGDQINNEAVSAEEEGFVIFEPKIKRDKNVVKAEINDVVKRMRADLLKAAKGQSLNVSIPYAEQLRVITPHILKLTKLFAELGGLKTKEIIDSVYEEISKAFPSVKRKDISEIVKQEFQKETKSPREVKLRDLVKKILIDAGYSRDVKVKGEVKTYLDWKKLAGEEGSVERIKETVEKSLIGKGYSNSQISEMADLLQKEYEDLRASIIEKSIRELQNRNTIKTRANIKGIAKKLAELYNYGLFDENMDAYNNLLNSALGFDSFQQEQFDKLKEYGRALSVLFGAENSLNNNKKLSELAVKTQANIINREIKNILRNAQFKNAPSYFKIATIIRDFVNISLTSKLMSAKQMIENPMSGFIERQFQNIGNMFDIKENGELKANRKKLAKYIYSDIVRNGGLFYGDVSNTLVSQSAVEYWLNKQSESKMYHFAVSAMLGRAYLNGADSMNKALLTEKNFTYNLIKMLTSDSNSQGKMTKDEAMKFVAEKITGQNFNDALKIASDLIDNVNSQAGKKLIPDNRENKYRFAIDIVKESLASGTELTLEQVEKAYNAGYKSAGFAIGHEANNPISLISNMGSARIEGLLDRAVKEKKWQEAAMYSILSTVVKGVINPFVGGSFNWMTLTLQKAGLDPVSIFSDLARSKSNPIDLSTETGLNNLQNALVRDTNLKNTYNRYIIGAGVSIITASLAVATGADDDLESWLKKNEWARKYFNVISPPALLLLMSVKNKDLGDYFTKLLNVKVDNMDANVRLLKSIDQEDQSTLGVLGQIIGQPFDLPLPWRVVRDIDNIKRGVNGRPLVKSTFKTNGFWNGWFQGGFSDYIGLRPGENYKIKEKIQQIRQDTKVYNEQVKQLAKEAVEEKYSEKVLNEKIYELFSKEPLKFEKTKNIFKNKAKEELIRKKIEDPFYIDFNRESNDEIQAVMFFDKFGDLNNLSDNKRLELSRNMDIIGFKGSDEFWINYWNLVNSEKKSK